MFQRNHSRIIFLAGMGLLILLSFASCASMSGKVAPEESLSDSTVIPAKGVSSEELYVKANSWFVDNFNSAESVIQFQDKEAGIIKGKYSFTYWEGLYEYRVHSVITIETKDDRCRISFDAPRYKVIADALNGSTANGYESDKIKIAMAEKINEVWDSLTASFTEAVKKASDNW